MKSFNSLVSDFLALSNDSSGTVLAKNLINIGTKKVLGLSDFTFNRDSKTYSSGTSTQWYDSPYNSAKIDYVAYEYGGTWYVPKEIRDGETWQTINSVSTTSSIPYYWFVSNATKRIGLYPASADASGTIKVGFTKKIRDFSVTDYSTGSVSAVSGGSIFTGVGSIWNAKMVGRYLQVSSGSTQLEDFWFEITSFGSATSVNVKESIPNAVSISNYTISEMIPLPDGYETLPLWYSLGQYYQMKEKPVLGREYERMYKEGIQDLLNTDSRSVSGLMEQQNLGTPEPPWSNPWTMGTIA